MQKGTSVILLPPQCTVIKTSSNKSNMGDTKHPTALLNMLTLHAYNDPQRLLMVFPSSSCLLVNLSYYVKLQQSINIYSYLVCQSGAHEREASLSPTSRWRPMVLSKPAHSQSWTSSTLPARHPTVGNLSGEELVPIFYLVWFLGDVFLVCPPRWYILYTAPRHSAFHPASGD